MIHEEKCIIIDLDGTLCPIKTENEKYDELRPHKEIVEQLRKYAMLGFHIVIHTSRNMRSYGGNIGMINANTLPAVIKWLNINQVPYNEIHIGKPWPGRGGFCVDDKTIRPSEFISLSYNQILELIQSE